MLIGIVIDIIIHDECQCQNYMIVNLSMYGKT